MLRIFKSLLTAGPTSRRPVKSHLSLTVLEAREVPAMLNAWTTGLRVVGAEITSQPVAAHSTPVVARPIVSTTDAVTVKVTSPVAAGAVKVMVTSPVATIPLEAAERAAFASVAKVTTATLVQQHTGMASTISQLAKLGVDTSGLAVGSARFHSPSVPGFDIPTTPGGSSHSGLQFDPRHPSQSNGSASDSGRLFHSPNQQWAADSVAVEWVAEFWNNLFTQTNTQLGGGVTGAVVTAAEIVTLSPAVGYSMYMAQQIDTLSDPVGFISYGGASYDLRTQGSTFHGERKWVPENKSVGDNVPKDGHTSPKDKPKADETDNGTASVGDPKPKTDETNGKKTASDGGTKTMPDQNKLQVRPLTDEELAEREQFRRSLTVNPGPGDAGLSTAGTRAPAGRLLTKTDLYGRPSPDANGLRPMTEAQLKASKAFIQGTISYPQSGDDASGGNGLQTADPVSADLMQSEQQNAAREVREEAAKKLSK